MRCPGDADGEKVEIAGLLTDDRHGTRHSLVETYEWQGEWLVVTGVLVPVEPLRFISIDLTVDSKELPLASFTPQF